MALHGVATAAGGPAVLELVDEPAGTYPLAEVADAQRALMTGHVRDKIALIP
jgi:hypothetical protein